MKWFFTFILSSLTLLLCAQKKLSFIRPSDTGNKIVFKYSGEVKDGKANGYGTGKGSDGTLYKGDWKDNDFNGKGNLSNEQGLQYEGDFVNGQMHGKGKATYPGGIQYEGDYKEGWQTGYGKKTHTNGKIEEGYFVENTFRATTADMMHTPAVTDEPQKDTESNTLYFTMPYYINTSLELIVMYRGAVKDNKANGYGEAEILLANSYTGNKKFSYYKGDWKNNNFHGKGLLDYVAGSKYEGDFLNGKPHGKGIYYFEGSGNYTGDFVNGKRQGKGVTTYSDGSKKEGEWYDDQFRGDGSATIPKEYIKEKTADDIAREAEEKDKKAKEAQAKLQQENDAKDPCKMGWNVYGYKKGLTRKYNGYYVILREFDCKTDMYKVWRPAQKREISGWDLPGMTLEVMGIEFRQFSFEPDKHWYTCKACDGDGTEEITVYTTKTKELPWGYFSGIETKRISTTSKTYTQLCKVCKGAAVLLK